MKPLLALLLSSATFCAHASPAEERCTGLAELASSIAEAKLSGIPQPAVASSLRAQYVQDTEQQREQNAMVERVIRLVYMLDEQPAQAYTTVFLKCRAGEFSTKEKALK